MKKIVLCLVVCVCAAFALPIVLEENIHRNNEKDSIFTLRFNSNSNFLQANNFFVRTKVSGILYDGDFTPHFTAYIGDSIGTKYMNLVVIGYFYNKAVLGETVDWVKPEKGFNKDTINAVDMYKLMLNFTPNEHILIGLGKNYYNWGPSQLGGLLLSDYNTGFIGLYQQYKFWGFTIKGLATQLSGTEWRNSKNETPEHRYFSAGRIEYYRERWGIAVSQSVIYAGQNRSFEIPYLIPVFPFHYGQIANWRYGNNGENTAGAIDAYANFFDKNWKIYGELFIDDIQGDKDDKSQSVQNSLAFIAGTKFNIPKIIYGFFEAGQINSFVYNHQSGYAMKYLNKDSFIGSPLGPDNQLFWGKLGHEFEKINLKTEIYGWLLRQGERNINYNIEENIGSQHGTKDDPIPFGNITTEAATWLSIIYEHKYCTAELYGGVSVNKTENVSGSKKTKPILGFSLNAAIGAGWNKK